MKLISLTLFSMNFMMKLETNFILFFFNFFQDFISSIKYAIIQVIKIWVNHGYLKFRLECLKFKEIRSQAKVIGTLVTFGGALLMAFYKGPGYTLFHSRSTAHHEDGSHASSHNHQATGALYILMGCVALSSFYILQVIN